MFTEEEKRSLLNAVENVIMMITGTSDEEELAELETLERISEKLRRESRKLRF